MPFAPQVPQTSASMSSRLDCLSSASVSASASALRLFRGHREGDPCYGRRKPLAALFLHEQSNGNPALESLTLLFPHYGQTLLSSRWRYSWDCLVLENPAQRAMDNKGKTPAPIGCGKAPLRNSSDSLSPEGLGGAVNSSRERSSVGELTNAENSSSSKCGYSSDGQAKLKMKYIVPPLSESFAERLLTSRRRTQKTLWTRIRIHVAQGRYRRVRWDLALPPEPSKTIRVRTKKAPNGYARSSGTLRAIVVFILLEVVRLYKGAVS